MKEEDKTSQSNKIIEEKQKDVLMKRVEKYTLIQNKLDTITSIDNQRDEQLKVAANVIDHERGQMGDQELSAHTNTLKSHEQSSDHDKSRIDDLYNKFAKKLEMNKQSFEPDMD